MTTCLISWGTGDGEDFRDTYGGDLTCSVTCMYDVLAREDVPLPDTPHNAATVTLGPETYTDGRETGDVIMVSYGEYPCPGEADFPEYCAGCGVMVTSGLEEPSGDCSQCPPLVVGLCRTDTADYCDECGTMTQVPMLPDESEE